MSSSSRTKFTRSRSRTIDKPSSSSKLRYHDSKPSLLATKSDGKFESKPYGLRQTVDVKVKSSTSKSSVPMSKALSRPPVVAAKSSESRDKNLLKDIKLTEPKKKETANLPTRKPPLPAPSLAPQLRRRTLAPQTKPSISTSRRSSTGILSSATQRQASVIAAMQISQQMSETDQDFDVKPALSSKIPSKLKNLPSSVSSKQPLTKLEPHVTPAVSQLVKETGSFKIVLDKLPIEDPNSSFSVQVVKEDSNDVFLLTTLKEKRNLRSNRAEEANSGDDTRTPTRLPRSCSKIASYQEQIDDISWDSSQGETNTPKSSRARRGHPKVRSSEPRETEEEGKKDLVTPSAFKRDRDVTFETEARPKFKRQRVMVPLRLQLADAAIVEENNTRDNTHFYTPERMCASEERDLDESAEGARYSAEMPREIVPFSNHDVEQRKTGWRCIVM